MSRRLVLAALALAAAGAAHAQSQPQLGTLDPKKPVYVTSHVDVTPDNTDRTAAAASAAVAGRGPVVAAAQGRIGDMYRRPAVNREARRG